MEMSNEHLINLINEYLKGSITSEKLRVLRTWIGENPDNKLSFNKYVSLILNARSITAIDNIDQIQAWKNVKNSIHKTRKINFRLITKIAASILILISISYSLFWIKTQNNILETNEYDFAQVAVPGKSQAILELSNGKTIELAEHKTELIEGRDGLIISKDSINEISYLAESNSISIGIYNTLKTPRGGEFSITLSDGTKVWLNAESEIRYPVTFDGNERNVYLKGEGYFEVAHNKQIPFYVNLENSTVEVLGTSFNVSAYKSQGFIATTLVEGSVNIISGSNVKLLTPGQQSKQFINSSEITIEEVDIDIYTAWVNGVFEFENMSLEYISDHLSRWYNVDFVFKNKECRDLYFTGGIKRDAPIDLLLEMIGKTTDVKFAIKENAIIISL